MSAAPVTTDVAAALRAAGIGGPGDVDDSTLARALYSTDASLYRIPPAVVVRPRDRDELLGVLAVSRSLGVPVTMRGAGTSIAGNAVGPGIHHAVDDRAAPGVSYQDRLAVQGIQSPDDGIDVSPQADVRPCCILRLQARECEGVDGVSGFLEGGDHLIPRRCVQPETGNQDDVHAGTLREAAPKMNTFCWIILVFLGGGLELARVPALMRRMMQQNPHLR